MAGPSILRKQAWPDQQETGGRLCCTWRTYQTRGLRSAVALLRLVPAGTPHVSARMSPPVDSFIPLHTEVWWESGF
jgi:hypothetical protein